MDFEYNGNLLEDDRINLVANEIVKKYPQVSFEKAKEAAMLEGKISAPKTLIDELNRLYNIMLVSNDNKNLVTVIYKDFLHLLSDSHFDVTSDRYIYVAYGISNYLENNMEFPYLDEY